MSQLIARILLAIFVIPIASLIYMVAFIQSERWLYRWINYQTYATYRDIARMRFGFSGLIAWAFLAIWWFLLWRKSVRWNGTRIGLTAGAVVLAAIAGIIVAAILNQSERGFGDFIGSATAPLLWIVATIFVWRETAAERAARVNNSGQDAIVCPTCGYNLTGLTEPRCPECGTQFTLDQLLASQPSRTRADLET
ncbi:MAG: hypothetical protein JWN40_4346 [Phycisphaerales bacterium]|nr:hypothetical protein [Phycisphaerales bacterium]